MVRTWAGDDLIDLDVHEGDEQAYLGVHLHPAAEPVELRIEQGRVEISAKTSTAGPGYHAWVCELLDALHAAGITWIEDDEHDDETGYFKERDFAALQQQMLLWLGSLAGVMRESAAEGNGGFQVSLAMDYTYEHDGAIATPLGPRDLEWLKRTEDDPRQRIDIFPWWDEGRGAGYELGRALSLIWTEVRFRVPLTADEKRTVADVLNRLSRAHALDPTRDYPWRAWAELLEHTGSLDAIAPAVIVRARDDRRAPLGYRRRSVRKSLGGFTIQIPGEFAEELSDNDWSMWCGDRTVWATSFRARDPERLALLEGDGPSGTPVTLRTELLSRAAWELSEQDDAYKLVAELAGKGKLLLLTILFDRRDDLDWAIQTASSVRG